MRLPLLIVLAIALPSQLFAQSAFRDVIYRRHGGPLTGRIATADATQIGCEVILVEGQPPAHVSLPRTEITRVAFAVDERLDAYLKHAGPGQLSQLEQLWQARRPLLNLPESNAGDIGLALADLQLDAGQAEQALFLFQEIESADWNADRKVAARNGKLRAKLALGHVDEVVKEAREIEEENAEPKLLIEAKFILAEAGLHALEKLQEENPRWQEDENILPERNRIYHETVDLYLFPFLFHGAEQAAAARGLSRLVELYQIADEPEHAIEAATDITSLYPTTNEAAQAKAFLVNRTPAKPN